MLTRGSRVSQMRSRSCAYTLIPPLPQHDVSGVGFEQLSLAIDAWINFSAERVDQNRSIVSQLGAIARQVAVGNHRPHLLAKF